MIFSNTDVDYKDQDEWTAGVHESILYPAYGKDKVLEFDKIWIDICKQYNVDSYPIQPWDNAKKTMVAVWESKQDIQEFIDCFFEHNLIIDFFNTLETGGWTILKTDRIN